MFDPYPTHGIHPVQTGLIAPVIMKDVPLPRTRTAVFVSEQRRAAFPGTASDARR